MFQIFSRQTTAPHKQANINFLPVDKTLFNKSLIHCTGIITGGGFETPAEALHLGKKLMCIPMRGQYEQQCNAAALKEMGVYCLKKIGSDFEMHFYHWLNNVKPVNINYENSIPHCLDYMFSEKQETYTIEQTATPAGLLSFLL